MFSSCIKRQVNAILGKCREDFLGSIVSGCREYRDKSGKVGNLYLYTHISESMYMVPCATKFDIASARMDPETDVEKSQQDWCVQLIMTAPMVLTESMIPEDGIIDE